MSEHECCNSDICCHCGTSLGKDSPKRPDPFNLEIFKSETLHRMCQDCRRRSADNI